MPNYFFAGFNVAAHGSQRAITLIDPPEFEVELRVLGRRPSERKVLSALYFEYTNRYIASKVGLV
jgi:hypothetical protein